MQYRLLTQTNPDYDARTWRELRALYEGGYTLQRRVRDLDLLPRVEGETEACHRERVASAAYINHLGEIVDFFVANLFAQDLTVTPAADASNPETVGEEPSADGFYEAFAHDCDRAGTAFADLLRAEFSNALLCRRAIVAVDLPAVGTAFATRAEEDAAGAARAYAFGVPVEQLIDWEYDDRGGFAWALLHRQIQRRATIVDTRDVVIDEFKAWETDPDTGAVRWRLFRSKPHKLTEPIRDDDDIPEVAGAATSFPRIPLFELCVPAGLWVGNKLGVLAREHLQRRTSLLSAENRSLFAIPYAKLGPEVPAIGGAIPAELAQDPHRGTDPVAQFRHRGFLTMGSQDDIKFAEPSGDCYELVDRQLEKLVDEMFRVTHQMAQSVSNTRTSLGRSGQSKQEDRHATAIVLGAMGAIVRDFAKRIYDFIAAIRGESIVWTPHGLDIFDVPDRDALVKEASALPMIRGAIPSRTFAAAYTTEIALQLADNLPPATQDAIRREIDEGIEAEAALAAAMQPEAPGEPDDDEPADGDEKPADST